MTAAPEQRIITGLLKCKCQVSTEALRDSAIDLAALAEQHAERERDRQLEEARQRDRRHFWVKTGVSRNFYGERGEINAWALIALEEAADCMVGELTAEMLPRQLPNGDREMVWLPPLPWESSAAAPPAALVEYERRIFTPRVYWDGRGKVTVWERIR